jgi:hypothetical protein
MLYVVAVVVPKFLRRFTKPGLGITAPRIAITAPASLFSRTTPP